MATISRGILGGFSGKAGPVIGGSWRGISYIRSKPGPRKTEPSQKQKEQQAKFRCMVSFLNRITGFLDVGFRTYAIRQLAVNAAMSYNLKNALTGTFPDYSVNYNLVLVSRGDLPGALNASVSAVDNGEIKFSWSDNSGQGKASAHDRVMLLAYCPALMQGIYKTAGAGRNIMQEVISADVFTGQIVHAWIGFTSADGKDVADSVYAGEVEV